MTVNDCCSCVLISTSASAVFCFLIALVTSGVAVVKSTLTNVTVVVGFLVLGISRCEIRFGFDLQTFDGRHTI